MKQLDEEEAKTTVATKVKPSTPKAPGTGGRLSVSTADLADERGEATRRAVLLPVRMLSASPFDSAQREEEWHLQWDAAKRAHSELCESIKFKGTGAGGADADAEALSALQQDIDDQAAELARLQQVRGRSRLHLKPVCRASTT